MTPEQEKQIRADDAQYTTPAHLALHRRMLLAELDSLRQQVETLTRERDEANACWNGSLEVQGELEAQVETLTKALVPILQRFKAMCANEECDCTMDGGVHTCELPEVEREITRAEQALNPDGKEESDVSKS